MESSVIGSYNCTVSIVKTLKALHSMILMDMTL